MEFRRLVIVLCVLFSNAGYAQTKSVDSLLRAFDQFRKINFEEKIYLHLDRPSYLTGETLRFKIYLVDASLHKPSAVSKVVYIEILDQDLKPIIQSKVEVAVGAGNGSLYLPATIGTGNYIIRAYTQWMKNYSADFYFHKEISIINPFVASVSNKPQVVEKLTAQFFPEGGNLVEGIESRVAFQLLDTSGKGVRCNGVIVDENMDTVVAFTPTHFGIGSFNLTPGVNKKYRAILQHKDFKATPIELPSASSFGYVMEVKEQAERLVIEIRSKNQSAVAMGYSFIHSRNRIVQANAIRLNNSVAHVSVDIADLPDGISHITFFDAMMKPVCERLYFKQPTKMNPLSITPNQASYLTRGQVKIDFDIAAAQPHPYDLSITIYKEDSITAATLTIQQYLLLTSDLKGTVEAPEFYFSNTSASKNAVDNLMLTHGWRRFKWDNVVEPKAEQKNFIPEIRGHIVQAIAKNGDSTRAGVLSYLASPGKIIRIYPSRSNDDGRMFFEMLDFYGKRKIMLQKDSREDSVSRFEIISPFSDDFTNQSPTYLELSKLWKSQLEERSVAMQVEDIYQPTVQQMSFIAVDSTAFYGKPDATYRLDDFTRFPIMEEVLREYVPGVFVRKRKDGFQFLVVDKDPNVAFRVSPLILLDGVPIFDEDEIMNFDPRLVKKLEVVQRRWIQGPVNFFGIVSFSTYTGDLAGFPLNPNSIVLDYEGLQLQREFYSPQYENKKQRESRLPDQRTLLYWNPTLITNDQGEAQIQFYTADLPGKYNVVVEGMNKNGDLCTATTSIIVKGSN